MHLASLAIAAIIALGALTALPVEASAAPPPRVPGLACNALAGHSNVWRTDYWMRFVNENGHTESQMFSPCFTSQASCEAWFYWAQTDWPDQIAVKRCYRTG